MQIMLKWRCGGQDKVIGIPTKAYETDTPGLVVCRVPDALRYWQVVHESSGYALSSIRNSKTRKVAKEAARELGPLTDWTQGEGAIKNDHRLYIAVIETLERYQ